VKSLRKHVPDAFLDVHLMVLHPARWVADFAAAGADMFTFHLEAVEGGEAEVRQLAAAVREAGMLCGLTIKPGTPVEAVLPYCADGTADMVLVMTVEPGFGGQKFQPAMMDKVGGEGWAPAPEVLACAQRAAGPNTCRGCAQPGAVLLSRGALCSPQAHCRPCPASHPMPNIPRVPAAAGARAAQPLPGFVH
jgi:ribulose-phosphate 3-epimerase